jgi:hypothetical protein
VLATDSQVDAEPVPGSVVAVFEVRLQAPHQVAGEADVVELLSPVERIDASLAADEISHGAWVLLEHLPGDVFQVLKNERLSQLGERLAKGSLPAWSAAPLGARERGALGDPLAQTGRAIERAP